MLKSLIDEESLQYSYSFPQLERVCNPFDQEAKKAAYESLFQDLKELFCPIIDNQLYRFMIWRKNFHNDEAKVFFLCNRPSLFVNRYPELGKDDYQSFVRSQVHFDSQGRCLFAEEWVRNQYKPLKEWKHWIYINLGQKRFEKLLKKHCESFEEFKEKAIKKKNQELVTADERSEQINQ